MFISISQRTRSILTACTACLLFASATHAAELLTLAEAQRQALQQQPQVDAWQRAAEAARAEAIAAGQLPDPQIKLGVINVPVTGTDTLRFNRDEMTMSTIGIMQSMVRQPKRKAAALRFRAQAEVLDAEGGNALQTIQRETALAWLNVFEAGKRIEVYQRMTDELHAERQVSAAQLSSGKVAAAELFQQDAMLAMANDRRLVAERDERKARSILARWTGRADTRPLPQELPEIIDPSSTDNPSALSRHPLLLAAQRSVEVNRQEAARARAEDLPNWGWEVMYGQRQGERSDMVSLQLTFDLPWDKPHRQHPRQAAAFASATQAELLAEDKQRELAAELEDVLAERDTALAREREHRTRLIPAANARLLLAQAAYRSGKDALSDVWEARRAVLEVELEHWMILTDHARALIRLHYLLDNCFPAKNC